jgi:hypothetical protein
MSKPSEKDFEAYKQAETKALSIVEQMRATGAKSVDIELALLVAIYELHKKQLPSETIGNIIKGHMATLEEYYGNDNPSRN